ncbi:hypothetical protein NC651_007868 [Populus alba x Populus x berolinensis]|nr:hypothetical protein NC651_007868 [Populus alba x Populus x berolinensis]
MSLILGIQCCQNVVVAGGIAVLKIYNGFDPIVDHGSHPRSRSWKITVLQRQDWSLAWASDPVRTGWVQPSPCGAELSPAKASLDSTAQTGHAKGADWQEEFYQKLDSHPQQPKSEQLEKLEVFKAMLERLITFLQLGQLPHPPVPQLQSQQNQLNLQLQSMNVHGAIPTMQQNNMSSLQHGSLSYLSGGLWFDSYKLRANLQRFDRQPHEHKKDNLRPLQASRCFPVPIRNRDSRSYAMLRPRWQNKDYGGKARGAKGRKRIGHASCCLVLILTCYCPETRVPTKSTVSSQDTFYPENHSSALHKGIHESVEEESVWLGQLKRVWIDVGPVSPCNRDIEDKAERGKEASIAQHEYSKWQTSLPLSLIKEIAAGLEASGNQFIWVGRRNKKSQEARRNGQEGC